VCESEQVMIYACGSLLSTQSEIRQTYCQRPGTITGHKDRMLGGEAESLRISCLNRHENANTNIEGLRPRPKSI